MAGHNPNPIRIDVPDDNRVVFGNDGRLFMDMGYMIDMLDDFVGNVEKGAGFNHNSSDKDFAEGARMVVSLLVASRDEISIEDSYLN
ncbi:hypothetical protein ncot_11855 [Nocardioides sp. JQ2195]|uniref:hypothetical protein n=1 Tax=Nocardioides sp. JQ2195 TaxID=2592334 RepID=UPI00143EB9E9|nr:hypothetical protein [Nocardioides sp. JQ2195]QIX27216.1 hypothetical protein ncot_11855 [Nocardioides sp. JQ2195]